VGVQDRLGVSGHGHGHGQDGQGRADGVHPPGYLVAEHLSTARPWKTDGYTDRPDGTDARPLCVRGHRNMTVYSDTR
jgi:hypothetical protein